MRPENSVTAHSVLLCGSLTHKVSTTNSLHCKDFPWEAGDGGSVSSPFCLSLWPIGGRGGCMGRGLIGEGTFGGGQEGAGEEETCWRG